MAIKTYVRVGCETDERGHVTPRWLVFKRRRYDISRVLDVAQAHAVNVGGFGTRFLVRIDGRKTYLFQEDSLRWFVEEKIPGEIPRVGGIVLVEQHRF